MCAAKVEDQAAAIALEQKPPVEPAATFRERTNSPKADPGVQMRLAVGERGRPHGGEDRGAAIRRNTLKEPGGRERLHGTRSAAAVISRSLPVRRARSVSRRRVVPALVASAAAIPYSEAK